MTCSAPSTICRGSGSRRSPSPTSLSAPTGATRTIAPRWALRRRESLTKSNPRLTWAITTKRAGGDQFFKFPRYNQFLEAWCVQHSEFFFSSDSGPYIWSLIFNKPALTVNVLGIYTFYHLHPQDLFIFKTPIDIKTGRPLEIDKLFGRQYLRRHKYAEEYRDIDNTSGEILEATVEMVENLTGGPPPATPAQVMFQKGLERCGYGYGKGRVGARFIEQYVERTSGVNRNARN